MCQLGYIVRSHIGWKGKRSIPYKGMEVSPKWACFETIRLMTIRNGQKRTIYADSGLELFQMVSETSTEQCVSEDASPQGVCTARSHID